MLGMHEINYLNGSPNDRSRIIAAYPDSVSVKFYKALNSQKKTLPTIADEIGVIIPYQKTIIEFYLDLEADYYSSEEKEILAQQLNVPVSNIWR